MMNRCIIKHQNRLRILKKNCIWTELDFWQIYWKLSLYRISVWLFMLYSHSLYIQTRHFTVLISWKVWRQLSKNSQMFTQTFYLYFFYLQCSHQEKQAVLQFTDLIESFSNLRENDYSAMHNIWFKKQSY